MKLFLTSAAALALSVGFAVAQGMPGQHFVENWDLDGDGQVTLAEAQERRTDVFASFDADEDGVLSAEEYIMFDEARANDMAENAGGHGKGNKAMQQAVNGMSLEFNDTDGNGSVSQEEFIANTGAWIEMMDKNGDGIVTTDDFGPRG